jgi:polyisoprenoid-binding protein YceI
MSSLPSYSDSLRAMYRGGRAGPTARWLAHLWARVFGLGLFPGRWVTLEVPGRRTGRITRFPLGAADWHGERYLVSFLGERCNWVQNVRAAGGRATLRHRHAVPCQLAEVPVSERAPIIKRYLAQVPGGRPHIPVDRHAPVADFAAIAPRYPVFQVIPQPGERRAPARQPRRRHWWRWIAGSVVALIALLVLAVGLVFNLAPVSPPLVLPTAPASAPVGPATGTWTVGAGSVAGFRVTESAIGFSNEVAGRTSAVTGRIAVAHGQVTVAVFRVGLAGLKVGGKSQPQFAASLRTRDFPAATFTLARPVRLPPAFASGATITLTATGDLTLRGVSHPVTVTISARRDGPVLQAAGSMPVAFATWGITQPGGFGFFGSLANHGVAEFLLVLHRR